LEGVEVQGAQMGIMEEEVDMDILEVQNTQIA